MDVQMPEMDGFETTAVIRAREKSTGRHIPIVAMTAHAMKGDRERCLQAGMDGYVAKPIQAAELLRAVVTLGSSPPIGSPPSTEPEKTEQVLDKDAALAEVGGNVRLFRELAGLFLDEYPRLLDEIRQAIGRRDAPSLKRAAHTLKGSVSNFRAPAAVGAAWKLEAMGIAGAWSGADQAFDVLLKEIQRVEEALTSMAQG
jgi:CheY-like chemotaxis protein